MISHWTATVLALLLLAAGLALVAVGGAAGWVGVALLFLAIGMAWRAK